MVKRDADVYRELGVFAGSLPVGLLVALHRALSEPLLHKSLSLLCANSHQSSGAV